MHSLPPTQQHITLQKVNITYMHPSPPDKKMIRMKKDETMMKTRKNIHFPSCFFQLVSQLVIQLEKSKHPFHTAKKTCIIFCDDDITTGIFFLAAGIPNVIFDAHEDRQMYPFLDTITYVFFVSCGEEEENKCADYQIRIRKHFQKRENSLFVFFQKANTPQFFFR